MAHIHVIGAGVSGLAAAVRLSGQGHRVSLYEGAAHGGGRCRSFHDAKLDCLIDNGNHLLLSGNRSVAAYLAECGVPDALAGPARAEFPFFDLQSGQRWVMRPNAGPIPWWVFCPSQRIPGSRAGDYLEGLKTRNPPKGATIAQVFDTARPLFRSLWEPLAVAALNTAPDEADARLLWPVLLETFGRGEAACRPRMAPDGLSAAFVDPALAVLASRGVDVHFSTRVRALVEDAGRIAGLETPAGTVPVEAGDRVILAVPAPMAAELLPGLDGPTETRAIVNLHFRLPTKVDGVAVIGVLGGVSQWIFRHRDIASVTVSAADHLLDTDADALAATVWPEVARSLDLPDLTMPPCRVLKEKRATFAQTPGAVAKRPAADKFIAKGLILAGDWTNTGLPATIEGAIRSGHRAVGVIENSHKIP